MLKEDRDCGWCHDRMNVRLVDNFGPVYECNKCDRAATVEVGL